MVTLLATRDASGAWRARCLLDGEPWAAGEERLREELRSRKPGDAVALTQLAAVVPARASDEVPGDDVLALENAGPASREARHWWWPA